MNFIGVASFTAPIFVVILQNLSLRPIDKGFFICYISDIISRMLFCGNSATLFG